jgi:pimeloyl-ACP methyl ester carboxylesterase
LRKARFRGQWLLLCLLLLVGGLLLLADVLAVPDVPLADLVRLYGGGTSKFVDVEGLRVHMRDEGQGPPLVLLHGTGASLHTWDGWEAALSGQHRVVRMDLPGFGLTGPSEAGDYSIPAFVAFLEAFRKKVGLDTFALGGNSLGGQIAWAYAVAYPQHVTELILVDPAGYPVQKPALVFRLARLPLLSSLLVHADPRPMVRRTLRTAYGDESKVTQELVRRYTLLALRAGNRAAFVARARVSQVDRSADIKKVAVPTLILWGQKDRLLPVSDAARFAAAIPGSKLVLYEGVGHVPMEEIPEQSAADAEAFLSRR